MNAGRDGAPRAEQLRQLSRKLLALERLCLSLSRVSEGELALVFSLLADQHAELRQLVQQMKTTRVRRTVLGNVRTEDS